MTAHAYSGLDLTGKTAIVTGASRGIGAATAELLRRRGARVIGVSRNAVEAEDIVADLGDEQAFSEVGRLIAERTDVVHILVNNAGAGAFGLTIDAATSGDWDHYLAVNAKAPFMLTKALLPHLRRAAGATIVNVSSVHALATTEGSRRTQPPRVRWSPSPGVWRSTSPRIAYGSVASCPAQPRRT